MLDRLNILELFGADKNKYHSCIITCYSFDFLFFEQRVLPMLRRAGMININVFVDAKMYQQQLANLDGNYIRKQSYSITPIQLNGAFHPKILMGIGKNNGFLAIGSGNLTNSGLSSNDEVWGAFHTYKTESNALPLIKSIFEYLQNLKPFCYGANLEKWEWLKKSSPWLSELSNMSVAKSATSDNETLTVLKNFSGTSIYKELLDNLPTEVPVNITIISPYYNKNGQVLTNLLNDLKPESMDVVLDDRFGTVPYQWGSHDNVQFHNWESVKSNGELESSRLHAKIIQFKYEHETYILTGSTNATIEALGTKTSIAKNAEMSLLIKVNENKNWLEELDIRIPLKSTFDINSYIKELLPNNTLASQKYNCYINYAELDLSQLTLYIADADKIPVNSSIIVEKTDGQLSNYVLPKECQTQIRIALDELDVELGFKVYILNTEGQRVSNYEKLHNVQLLQRTNPDEKSSKFFEIINGTELRNTDLETLLDFANFKDVSHIENKNANRALTISKEKQENTKEYNEVSEDEFNKNQDVIEVHSKGVASHLTLLEDFLNNMTFRDVGEDFSDSSELAAEKAKESGLDGDKPAVNYQITLTFHQGNREKGRLHKTYDEINVSLISKHKDVLDNLVENLLSSKKATIENLQSLLVGTHLLFMKSSEIYYEERFKIIISYEEIGALALFEKTKGINLKRLNGYKNLKRNEVAFSADANALDDIGQIISACEGVKLLLNDETPSISIPHGFFNDNPIFLKDSLDVSSKKGFLINSVSKLLLILTNGIEDYSDQELLRFKTFKKQLFYRVLIVFSSLKWSNKEFQLAELFLLNVFYLLRPDSISVTEVSEELEMFKNKLNISKIDCARSEALISQTLISFMKWENIYIDDKKELIRKMDRSTIGDIIFKSKLGFAIVTSNYKGTLNLKTPLGFFNKENKEFEIKNIKGGLKAIMYKV
ncbi:MAG: hypothetical protein ACI93P_002228 [bacterium]|jgi:hypothetical protein